MHLYTHITLILVATLNLVHGQSRFCPTGATPKARKELRMLSPAEWSAYVSAVKKLMSKSTSSTAVSAYDTIVKTHVDYQLPIHGYPRFFPWHRIYLREFEMKIQEISPDVTVPFWDWSMDSQAPETSIVFKSAYFGGNGSGRNNCVTTGQFSKWTPRYPNKHCLTRKFDKGRKISSWYSTEMINQAINTANDYDQLRQNIETVPHASVHVNIGNDFGKMISPNDPIFFSHHSYIDYIWDSWQWTATDWRDYRGTNLDGTDATLDDVMVPYKDTVRQVLDAYAMCYYYDDGSSNSNLRRRQKDTSPAQPTPSVPVNPPTTIPNVQITKETAPQVLVASSDRTKLVKLRTPNPIPERWIRQNNHDIEVVRRIEREFARTYNTINKLSSYVSPCALVKRTDALKAISKDEKQLEAHIDDKVVRVNLGDREGHNAVDFIRKAMKGAGAPINQPDEKHREALRHIIGDFCMAPLLHEFSQQFYDRAQRQP